MWLIKEGIMANNTVEAAFIIPLLIGIIMVFLYVLFAVHDRGVIHILSDMSIREIKVCENSDKYTVLKEGDDYSDIEKSIKDNIGKKLILYRLDEVKIKNKKASVDINVKAHMRVSLPFVSGVISDFNNYEYKYSDKKISYCTSVRMLESGKVAMN